MTFPDAKMRHCDHIGKGALAMPCRSRTYDAAGFRMPTVTVYRLRPIVNADQASANHEIKWEGAR
ncbi:MAG TPA: hypothetical protein VGN55_04280 [Xanthobacteraceae bacterium]|jgi:hypothetical protein